MIQQTSSSHHSLYKVYRIKWIILVFLAANYLSGQMTKEDACEIRYHGDICDLNDSTVAVPEEVVALSSKVAVNPPTNVVQMSAGAPSIFFYNRPFSEYVQPDR